MYSGARNGRTTTAAEPADAPAINERRDTRRAMLSSLPRSPREPRYSTMLGDGWATRGDVRKGAPMAAGAPGQQHSRGKDGREHDLVDGAPSAGMQQLAR